MNGDDTKKSSDFIHPCMVLLCIRKSMCVVFGAADYKRQSKHVLVFKPKAFSIQEPQSSLARSAGPCYDAFGQRTLALIPHGPHSKIYRGADGTGMPSSDVSVRPIE